MLPSPGQFVFPKSLYHAVRVPAFHNESAMSFPHTILFHAIV